MPLNTIHLFTRFFFFFAFFRATPTAYGSSQARGQIWATAVSLHHSHSNVGSEPHLRPTPQLTAHRVRPGIKLVSSWILVRFITAEPQQELLFLLPFSPSLCLSYARVCSFFVENVFYGNLIRVVYFLNAWIFWFSPIKTSILPYWFCDLF